MRIRSIMIVVLAMALLGPTVTISSAQGDSSTVSITAGATNCPADAYSPAGFDPSGCTPGVGITMIAQSDDGSQSGSCVTGATSGAYAICEITGLDITDLSPDSTFLLSEDPSTIPAGYEVYSTAQLGIPLATLTSGNTVIQRFSNVQTSEVQPEPTTASQPGPTTAPDVSTTTSRASNGGARVDLPASTQPPASSTTESSSAAIYAGACDTKDLGDPVADLVDVAAPSGDRVGADDASAIETSFSTIDLSLGDMTTDDHVLVVFDEDEPDVVLACGPVGGIVAEDGSLAIGLRAQGDSRFSGVAYLAPSGEGTAVSIFLAEDLAGEQDGN